MSDFATASLIKHLRKRSNYTIQKVSKILGVSKAAVSKWENGDDITLEHLYDLSKLYNVSCSELLNGRLNNETNSDYWRRNYDLSNYRLDEDINDKNVNEVKILFEHCNMVKSRFLDLLPRWSNDELSALEIEEFQFIKQYYKFDSKYYAYKRNKGNYAFLLTINNEKEFVKDIVLNYQNAKKEEYLWELSKVYDFIYDCNETMICESNNLKAIEYMLSFFSQIEKDQILYNNLYITKEEVEEICDHNVR